MSGLRAIVSSRLTGELGRVGHYPQLVTIQADTPARNEYGEESASWSGVSGLADLPAQITSTGGNEFRTATGVWSESTHVIALARYLTGVTTRNRVVDGDGVAYDILAIEADPQHAWTRLVCRVVTA